MGPTIYLEYFYINYFFNSITNKYFSPSVSFGSKLKGSLSYHKTTLPRHHLHPTTLSTITQPTFR